MPHTVTLDRARQRLVHGQQERHDRQARPEHGRDHRLQDARPGGARTRTRRSSTAQGILWFTLQQSNMMGRLDPTTRRHQAGHHEDAGRAALRHQDRRAGDAVGRLQRQQLPGQGRPGDDGAHRDQAADPGDHGPAARHRRRRHDLVRQLVAGPARPATTRQTGEIKEWPSPSGPKSHPYAIAVVDGIVWYNESGMRPDALVRFDPATETFQSWPIPSGERLCRHHQAHAADPGRQPADPPEQHQPHHPGDAEAPQRHAVDPAPSPSMARRPAR